MLRVFVLLWILTGFSSCSIINLGKDAFGGLEKDKKNDSGKLLTGLVVLSAATGYGTQGLYNTCKDSSQSCLIDNKDETTCYDKGYAFFGCSACSLFGSGMTTLYSNSMCKDLGFTDGMKSSNGTYRCKYDMGEFSSTQPCTDQVINLIFGSDNEPPKVSSTNPSNGSNLSSIVVAYIYFNEAIRGSTVNSNSVQVYLNGVKFNTTSFYNLRYNSSSSAIEQYLYSTSKGTYTITLTRDIKDIKGNQMAQDYTFSFTVQ